MSIEDLARHGEQIEKLVEELTALRTWKEKARPFLETLKFNTANQLAYDALWTKERTEKEELYEDLTELLRGDDEN